MVINLNVIIVLYRARNTQKIKQKNRELAPNQIYLFITIATVTAYHKRKSYVT